MFIVYKDHNKKEWVNLDLVVHAECFNEGNSKSIYWIIFSTINGKTYFWKYILEQDRDNKFDKINKVLEEHFHIFL